MLDLELAKFNSTLTPYSTRNKLWSGDPGRMLDLLMWFVDWLRGIAFNAWEEVTSSFRS